MVPQIVGPGWARRPWPWGLPRRRLYGTGAGVPVRAFIMDVHASGAVTTHEVGRVWGGRRISDFRAQTGQAAAPIEVDLLNSDGVIVSIAAVDPNYWASSSASATSYVQQRGFDFFVPGGPPATGTAERSVASLADVQNWLAAQDVGVVRRPSAGAPITLSTPVLLGAGGLVGGATFLLGASPPIAAALGLATAIALWWHYNRPSGR